MRGVGEISKACTKTFKVKDGIEKVQIPKLTCYLLATIRPEVSTMKTVPAYVTPVGIR